MIDRLLQFLGQCLRSFMLWGYGWQRRSINMLSRHTYQWQDPVTGLWYREKAAVQLLKVNVMDEYRR